MGEGVALADLVALPDLDVNEKATVEPTRKAASDTGWIFMIYSSSDWITVVRRSGS